MAIVQRKPQQQRLPELVASSVVFAIKRGEGLDVPRTDLLVAVKHLSSRNTDQALTIQGLQEALKAFQSPGHKPKKRAKWRRTT